MAIINQNKSSLTNTNIGDKIPTTSNNSGSNIPDQSKKRSFLASVIDELKKVEWPGFRYVINWSLLVICFTAVFSLILGGADHVFETGINFVSCSSSKGKARDLGTCSTEAAKKLFGVNES
jgi:preprotein translocase SecE subunit